MHHAAAPHPTPPAGLPTGLPIGPDKPWLAPLAGYSDLPFRMLCRRYGAACCETEMVSVKGLLYGGHGSQRLLTSLEADRPLVLQLFGAEPDIYRRVMPGLAARGFTHFDLNCGCSVRKVTKSGSGSALMAKPGVLLEIVRAMVEVAGPGNVGVKLRLGQDADSHNYLELGQRLAEAGVGWLTLHPRTARQLFGGQAHWEHIARLARAVPVPVIASGDLFTAEDAARCLAETACAGVMFARGALTDPMVFDRLRDLLAGREPRPRTAQALAEAAMAHIALSRELDGEAQASSRAFRALRAFLPRYAKGFSGIRALRQRLLDCQDWDQLLAEAASIAGLQALEDGADPAHMADLAPDCGA